MISVPRTMNGLLAVAGVALLIILISVLLVPLHSSIGATRFEQHAGLCTNQPRDTPYTHAGLDQLMSGASASKCSQVVSLPDRSGTDGVQLMRYSVDSMGVALYRFRYDIPPHWAGDEPVMIYSPRVLGVAWQVRVNGQVVSDNLDDWRMTWNRPIAVRLGRAQSRPGDPLDIAIAVAYEPQTGHALARLSVGPESALAQRFAARQFLQVVMPVACSVATLLAMGVFFLSAVLGIAAP